MKAGAYIRVSLDRGEGQSAEEQRRETEAGAREDGAEIVIEEVEHNVSGGKAASLRALDKLVRACERGEIEVVYVFDFSRFSREHPFDAMATLARINAVGARLVGLSPWRFDSSRPEDVGRIMNDSQQGWTYREGVKRRWRNTHERKVAEGVWMGHAPFGYSKGDDGRLVPNDDAPKVLDAFKARAAGASIPEVAAILGDGFNTMNTPRLLARRVYRGVVRHGDLINEHGHPEIVDEATWQAAQREPAKHDKRAPSTHLLSGLCRCEGCGYTMSFKEIAEGRDVYACVNGRARGCKAPARIAAEEIERMVENALREAYERVELEGAPENAPDLAKLAREHNDATRRLEQAKAKDVQEMLGHDEWVKLLGERKKEADRAAAALGEAQAISEQGETYSLMDEWDEGDLEARRAMTARDFEMFSISRAKVVTTWLHGSAPDDLPMQGHRRTVEARPLVVPPAALHTDGMRYVYPRHEVTGTDEERAAASRRKGERVRFRVA